MGQVIFKLFKSYNTFDGVLLIQCSFTCLCCVDYHIHGNLNIMKRYNTCFNFHKESQLKSLLFSLEELYEIISSSKLRSGKH